MRAHCVPLPTPGPPSTKTTEGPNRAWTSLHTPSFDCSALTVRKRPCLLKRSITGIESLRKVMKRFRMDSMLSSTRPLVLPRSSSLASMQASEHSKNKVNLTSAFSPITVFHARKLSSLRGNPSTRYFPCSQPWRRMACSINTTVISAGTSFPPLMQSSMSWPYWEPSRDRSSRRRSPALRCTYPYVRDMREHWVPLPAPGPPSTNTTCGRPPVPSAAATAVAAAPPPSARSGGVRQLVSK
mmetsp:Transcript_47718/g.139075  ORF Transcript_47718/g.139075 Transcript_47718/m.139075 type:complete len:241 (+) Transcript_47718:3955-4677(+)